MKLKRAKLINFCRFTDFEIEFNDTITHLVGINGSGKTTIGLTAIWACLKGIAERGKDCLIGERFRFIGKAGKSADIELEFFDEKKKLTVTVNNHITATSNNISFSSSDGAIDQQWINDFFNVSFLSAKHFSELSSKDQALALGINTDKFDKEIGYIKTEYTLINRDLSKLGIIEEVEKVEHVDVGKLVEERKEREEFNYIQEADNEVINEYKLEIESFEKAIEDVYIQIEELEKEKKSHNDKMKGLKTRMESLRKPQDKLLFGDIDEKIKQSGEVNKKAAAYEQYLKDAKEAKEIQERLDKNKQLQAQKQAERTAYVKAKKLPFADLTIDDKGQLMLKNRPIKPPYFSKGELEIIVAKLYLTLYGDKDDALKMRFIDDFELLDEENQSKLLDALTKESFQILTAEVGNRNRENCILLRECKIVKDEEGILNIFNDE